MGNHAIGTLWFVLSPLSIWLNHQTIWAIASNSIVDVGVEMEDTQYNG
jgi:hypothetical protein